MNDATDIANTTRILRETLELEREATRRYAEHQSWAADPRLCAYWEGLRRNESDHRAQILSELAQLGAAGEWPAPAAAASPGAGRGSGGVSPGGASPYDTGPPYDIGPPYDTGPPNPAASPDPGDPRGFARALATLRSDVEFERAAVEKYAEFAKALDDPRLKALMREFVRAETGHGRGLKRTIEQVTATDYPIVLFCPTCGWQLDFGAAPTEGARVHCPMCAMTFALAVRDGQFVLDRV
jgi:rubrerythrin